MKLYAHLKNENTFEYEVKNQIEAQNMGWSQVDLDVGFDGKFYLAGHAPAQPEKSYAEKRKAEYPDLADQLDMIYWDKVNGTNLWVEKITQIKTKYPKG